MILFLIELLNVQSLSLKIDSEIQYNELIKLIPKNWYSVRITVKKLKNSIEILAVVEGRGHMFRYYILKGKFGDFYQNHFKIYAILENAISSILV